MADRPFHFLRGVAYFFLAGFIAYPVKLLSIMILGLTWAEIGNEMILSVWGFHLPISLFGFILALLFLRQYPTPQTEARFIRWAWVTAIAIGAAIAVGFVTMFQVPSVEAAFGDTAGAQAGIALFFGVARTVIAVAILFWVLFLPKSKDFLWPKPRASA